MKKSELVQMIREVLTELNDTGMIDRAAKKAATFSIGAKRAADKEMSKKKPNMAVVRGHDREEIRRGNQATTFTNYEPRATQQNKVSSQHIKNPATGKDILAMTAYKAGPKHPAYNAAKSLLKKENTMKKSELVQMIREEIRNLTREASGEAAQDREIAMGARGAPPAKHSPNKGALVAPGKSDYRTHQGNLKVGSTWKAPNGKFGGKARSKDGMSVIRYFSKEADAKAFASSKPATGF